MKLEDSVRHKWVKQSFLSLKGTGYSWFSQVRQLLKLPVCFPALRYHFKRGLFLKERICSLWEQILSLKRRPLFRRGQNDFDRVVDPENVPLPVKSLFTRKLITGIDIVYHIKENKNKKNNKKQKKKKKKKKKKKNEPAHDKLCDQQILRSACTSTQYGKGSHLSLFGKH